MIAKRILRDMKEHLVAALVLGNLSGSVELPHSPWIQNVQSHEQSCLNICELSCSSGMICGDNDNKCVEQARAVAARCRDNCRISCKPH